MGSVNCPFKSDCTDYPHMCNSCANNKNRSYYKPKDIIWERFPPIHFDYPRDKRKWKRYYCYTD